MRRRRGATPNLAAGALAAATLLVGMVVGVAAASLPASSVSSMTLQPQPRPGTCHARGDAPFTLPDRHCTPGAVDPSVKPSNIHSTICRRGYTKKVRPPESVIRREKRASMASYGDSGSPRAYEYDHLVALELGGARNDPRNLWPQPGRSPNRKDRLENELHRMVCAEEIALSVAQRDLAGNWVKTYRHLIG